MPYLSACFGGGNVIKKPQTRRVSRTDGTKSTFKAAVKQISAPLRHVVAPVAGCFTSSRPGAHASSGLATSQVAQGAPESSAKVECRLADAKQQLGVDHIGVIFPGCGTEPRSSISKTLTSDAQPSEVSSSSPVDQEAGLDRASLVTNNLSSDVVLPDSSSPPVHSTLQHGAADKVKSSALPSRPDSPDFAALVSEALFRLATRASEEAAAKLKASGTEDAATAHMNDAVTSSSQADTEPTASTGVVIEASSITVQRFVVDQVLDNLISRIAEETPFMPAADPISSSALHLPAVPIPSHSQATDSHPVSLTSPVSSCRLHQDAADAAIHGAALGQKSTAVGVTDLEQCGLADYVMDELLEQVVAETSQGEEAVEWEVLAPASPSTNSLVTADKCSEQFASTSSAAEVCSPACSTSEEVQVVEPFTSSPQSIQTASSLSLADLPAVALDISYAISPNPASPADLADHLLTAPSRSEVGRHAAEGRASSSCQDIQAGEGATGPTQVAHRDDQWWMDSSTFQDLLKGVPTQLEQGWWGEWQAGGDLGAGPAHRTFLSMPPRPSSLKPAVIKIVVENGMVEPRGAEGGVGREACLLGLCRHPNVVPITFLGLKRGTPPGQAFNPSQVAYFGMPMADMSLKKNLGSEAWGRRGQVGGGYHGPSLFQLVKHAQAILRPLASVHRRGLLHRALTPDHVLLFGKEDSREADRSNLSSGEAEPIKYDVKLTGFGAAVKLNSQGCALQPSPYRCEEGYIPPEAHGGAPLTPAADIYQLGGVCYFMALGSDPPSPCLGSHYPSAGAQAEGLPEYVPLEWRKLVGQCRQADPLHRPTTAQLHLHLLDLLQRVSQAKQAARTNPPRSLLSIALEPYQMASGARALSPSVSAATSFTASTDSSDSTDGMDILPVASMNSPPRPTWLPFMLTNPMYSPTKSPLHPPSPQALYCSTTRASPQHERSAAAMPEGHSPTALARVAAGLESLIRRPTTMPAVDQPQQSAAPVDYSPVCRSSSSSSSCGENAMLSRDPSLNRSLTAARFGLNQSSGTKGTASHTEVRGSNSAAQQTLQRRSSSSSSSGSSNGISSAAKSALQKYSFGNSRSQKQPQLTLQLSGLPSADVRRTPGGGLTAVFTPDWEEVDLDTGLSPVPSAIQLASHAHDNVSQIIKLAADPAHLVATTAGAVSSRAAPRSPGRRAAPRRDDSALEQAGRPSWLSRTQGKAAALAANVTRKASEAMDQWTESQLSTKTIWPLQ